MAKITKSVRINASVDRVFDYLSNPEHLLEVWPNMMEVSNIKQTADGGRSYDWVYKMAGLKFHGHADTVAIEKNKRIVVKNDTGIPSTFEWTYAGEDGGMRLSVSVEYTMPVPVLHKLAEKLVHRMNERDVDTLLEHIKGRVESMEPATMRARPTPTPRH
jgi:uncharacterized protein YndB with AHSA1/START domain